MKRCLICFALVCLTMGVATTSFAVPPKQVLNITRNQTLTGACCFAWNVQKVSITEPAKVQSVVVTFETDFELPTVDTFTVGLMVNGGPCRTDLGPATLNESVSDHQGFLVESVEWVVEAEDGLQPGNNTFTVCGGCPKSTSQITLGYNSLAVRISK